MSADPVRRQALDILLAVQRGEPLDPHLERAQSRLPEPRERAFLAELVRGTLQWQGRYDHLITVFSSRGSPAEPALAAVLRLALHQLLQLDGVPAYAALHQAGELCRATVGQRQVGYVNGLLQAVRRRLALGDGASPQERLAALRPHFADLERDPVAWAAAWHSHPRWLVERWAGRFGAETAAAICAHNNREVPLAFHVLAPAEAAATAAALEAAGCPTAPGILPRTLVAGRRLPRSELAGLLDRFPCLIVQDPTVQQAVAWLLAGGEPPARPPADLPVVDLCAAPGGKTAHLDRSWPGTGPVVAMDDRRGRMALLQATVRRVAARRVLLAQADGQRPPLRAGSCAGVLLDGPCSGTGVLRHHPDGRWKLAPEVPGRKGRLLLELARRAADLLAPGGLLLYATCSLEAAENEEVLDELLAGRDDLVPAPPTAAEDRWRRLWLPHEAAGDGFFAARLRKRGFAERTAP